MRQIILNSAGGVENLQMIDLPKPSISDNEVLVKVIALSINPVDYKARSNENTLSWIFGSERPVTLGWDLSGSIEQVGAAVTNFKVGDEVFGMANFPGKGNAYAEYVAVSASHLALKPKSTSHQHAAAATLAALTAWQVMNNGRVKKGDTVLIHGAAGGVGHFALQIANYLGATVIGTSSAKNKDFVLQNGASKHIDYQTENFETTLSILHAA